MRPLRLGTLGLGALLLGSLCLSSLSGCSSDSGETPFDAGELPDGIGGGGEDSAASNPDTGTITPAGDAGDATITNPTPDSGIASQDASDSAAPDGADSSVVDSGTEKEDASDASHADSGHDAGETADAGHDAGETADASQADASDSAAPPDASSVDASSATDATIADSAAAADASPEAATDDASDDSAAPAGDAAPACVSCGVTVTYLGNTAAFAGGGSVTLMGGTVADGETVSAITQTYPKGSAAAHLVYATNASFTPATDVLMTYDTNQPDPSNDQWYAVLPVQSSGTTVYWYVQADGCDCATTLYDPGNFMNFTYTEQ